MEDGKLSLCQSSNTNESLTDTMIKTLLDSSEAVQTQPTAKHICVFTWVSLRIWQGTAITATSGYALGMTGSGGEDGDKRKRGSE